MLDVDARHSREFRGGAQLQRVAAQGAVDRERREAGLRRNLGNGESECPPPELKPRRRLLLAALLAGLVTRSKMTTAPAAQRAGGEPVHRGAGLFDRIGDVTPRPSHPR